MGKISMPQGKGNLMHNRRDYEEMPEHIDESRISQNVTVVDRDIREVYEELFGESVREFNSRQTHANRRIEDYHDHIANSKQTKGQKQVFYEDVVQWGKRDDFIAHPETREIAKEALLAYANSFEERNPNLSLVGAYIHMDEASPHLHLDYVPVGHYSRGLKTKNALDRAMKEMGIEPRGEGKIGNATQTWKEREREYFAGICRDMGLKVDAEEPSTRKNLSVSEYKEARDRMRQTAKQSIKREIAQLKFTEKQKIAKQWAELKDAQTALDARKDELERQDAELSKRELKVAERELKVKDIDARETAVTEREQKAAEKEKLQDATQTALDARQSDLDAKADELTIREQHVAERENTVSADELTLKDAQDALQDAQNNIKEQNENLRKRANRLMQRTRDQDRKHKANLSTLSKQEQALSDAKDSNQAVLQNIRDATKTMADMKTQLQTMTVQQLQELQDGLALKTSAANAAEFTEWLQSKQPQDGMSL